MIGCGIGLTSGGRRVWTPRRLGGLIYGYQVPLVGEVVDGAAVSSAPSTFGGTLTSPLTQAAVSQKPLITTASPLDGHAGLVLTYAGVSSLASGATVYAGGKAPHTVAWIGKLTGPGNSFTAVVRFGTTGQANTNSILGASAATTYWAGRGQNGGPSSSFGDNAYHLFVKTYDGVTVRLYVDGELYASVVDTSYAVAAGIAIGEGFYGTTDSILRAAFFASLAWSAAPTGDIQLLGAWTKHVYPTLTKAPLLVVLADSQAAGYGSSVAPNNWPTLIKSLGFLPAGWEVSYAGTDASKPWGPTAVGGWTADEVVNGAGGITPLDGTYIHNGVYRYSAMRDKNVVVVSLGTNDMFGAAGTRFRDPSAIYALLTIIVAALKAAGFYVVIVTQLKRTQPGTPTTYAADQVALRDMTITNDAGAHAVVDAANPAWSLNDTDDLTYFQADKVHLNPDGETILAGWIATAALAA